MNTQLTSLVNAISNLKGCKFAHIQYTTEVKVPKKLGLSGPVTKRAAGQVQINFSYSNAVNNRRVKEGVEGEFVAQSLPWGSWESPNKVISHNGNKYLRFYLANKNELTTEWYVGGREATPDEVEVITSYIKGLNKKSVHQGISNEVKPMVVQFENIEAFKCMNILYKK